ncbi:MAG: hypothetical protein AB7T27_11930 [Kiritimatiellia bacterium]
MSQKFFCAACAFLFASGLTAQAFDKMELTADIRPGSILLHTADGDFEVKGPGPERLNTYEIEEAGAISTLPNINLGVGFADPNLYLDLTATAGFLINSRFNSPMIGANAALTFRPEKNFAVGPHLGLMHFVDPEWKGDAELEISDSSALLIGMQASLGYDVLFILSVDYLYADPMDVTAEEEWITSDDELDISGIAIQFGIQGRF